jgi:cytochrome c oxidase subunit 2
MPDGLSTLAPTVDNLFYFVTWVSTILFAGVIIAMIYFAIRYRRRSAEYVPVPVEESKVLEISWIVIPTILVLITFNWGFKGYMKLAVSPPDSYQITVRAKQWLWEFEYPNGLVTTNELHVPVGRPVRLHMSSEDVLHSLFIPVFRVKQDVLPNRYTSLWFEATTEGEYDVFCTEYCGTSHSGMLAKVVVESQEAFQTWLESGGGMADLPLEELGEQLYRQQGCVACHTIDGSRLVGPSFQNLFGSQRTFEDGSSAVADENYIRQSIIEPNAHIVQGFQPLMPASYGSLQERQISALIAFIQQQQ